MVKKDHSIQKTVSTVPNTPFQLNGVSDKDNLVLSILNRKKNVE